MDIRGKTIVITGGATGIGRATAVAFARRGAAMIHIADIDEVGMGETAALVADLQGRTTLHRVDMADVGAVAAFMAGLPAYDVLYNNAGVVSGAAQFPDAAVAKLQAILDINVTSLIVATQAAVQAMRARGGGVVVNTVSTVALSKGFSDVLYATTKAAVFMFTRSCRPLKEEAGVRVMGVLPGLTNTPILKKTGADGDYAPWMAPILSGNLMCEPSDIAEAVMLLVENDDLPGGDWVAVRKIDGAIVHQWGHEEG